MIHHELYHLIEFEIAHDVYWKDPQWTALNSASFHYGKGGASTYKSSGNYYEMVHPQPGFVNRYSLSGVEEDKAEVFACLFIESENKNLLRWTPSDPILAAKITRIKNGLQTLDPAMNAEFWNHLDQEPSRFKPAIIARFESRKETPRPARIPVLGPAT